MVEHGGRASVLDLETDLALLGERVDRVDHCTGLERAVEGEDELDRVRHEECHAIALFDAALRQRRGDAIGRSVEIGIGHHAIAGE